MDENPTSKINLYRDRWTSLKVLRPTYQIIRGLAIRSGSSQADYLARMVRLLELVAERHGGDPVQILERLSDREETNCS